MTAARQADAVEALVGLLSDRTREARDRQVTQRPPGPSERGSPPRTWGIRRSWPRSGTSSTVHPHARGEYGRRRPDPGQPQVHPHARGEYARRRRAVRAGSRFTPTHVGNTMRTESPNLLLTVHPHARGEYALVAVLALGSYGSPPRTWGIRPVSLAAFVKPRFTPTHAGNTPMQRHSLSELLGSPPRTWGILVAFAGRERGRRFTPTHVGNT